MSALALSIDRIDYHRSDRAAAYGGGDIHCGGGIEGDDIAGVGFEQRLAHGRAGISGESGGDKCPGGDHLDAVQGEADGGGGVGTGGGGE